MAAGIGPALSEAAVQPGLRDSVCVWKEGEERTGRRPLLPDNDPAGRPAAGEVLGQVTSASRGVRKADVSAPDLLGFEGKEVGVPGQPGGEFPPGEKSASDVRKQGGCWEAPTASRQTPPEMLF